MDNFRAVEKEEQGAKKKLKLKEEAPPVTDCLFSWWLDATFQLWLSTTSTETEALFSHG